MIIQRSAAGLRLIGQADHARLAGDIAVAWGNDLFPVPEPWGPAVRATTRHDDGWIEWDRSPSLQEDGAPNDFISCPMTERLDVYRSGLAAVESDEAHVRLLVSLHLTGLFLGRYEETATRYLDLLPARDRAQAQTFVEEQQLWQKEVQDSIDADWMTQYRLLQVFDRISLALCMRPIDEMAPTTIHHVPMAEGTGDVTLENLGGGVLRLTPSPLADDLSLSLPMKILDREVFEDREDLRQALSGAGVEPLSLSFVR